MHKFVPMTMLASTIGVAALVPAHQPDLGPDKLLTSKLSKDPLESEAAEPHRRAAKRAAAEEQETAPAAAAAGGGASPQLEAIAACESGGNPTAVSVGGAYRGKYQFSPATWQAVGGQGDPAAAPEAEQDRRAAILMERSGPGQWPVCSA